MEHIVWKKYSNDVYFTTKYVFLASKICGLHPFKRDMSRSTIWTAYTLFVAFFCFLVPVYFWFRLSRENQSWYSSDLEVIFTKIVVFFLYSGLGLSVLLSIFIGGGLRAALISIGSADEAMGRSGNTFVYREGTNLIRSAALRILFVALFWAAENSLARVYSFDISTGLYLYVVMGYANGWSFRAVVRILRDHLAALGNDLREPAPLKSMRPAGLEALVRAYAELSDASDFLSEAYSGRLLFSIATILLFSTSHLFYLRRAILRSIDEHVSFKDIAFLLSMIIFGVFLYMQIFDIVIPCTEASNQANKFNKTLYKLMMEDKSKELINNVKLRLHMTVKKEIKFTAAGFLPLDFTLIHSMAAAVTTYFIILLQFSPPEKE